MLHRSIVLTAAALMVASGAMAQTKTPGKPSTQAPAQAEVTLKVGDIAPPMVAGGTWVKGEKVEQFAKGTIYIVEFWATWCGPCRESIPHLSKLQKQYKDKHVVVIGVAGSERGADSETKLKLVQDFVKSQGNSMDYRVLFDPDRVVNKAWMVAAGEKYIPRAFLVGGDGHVAWIGDPRTGLDKELEKAIKANKQLGEAEAQGPQITLVSQQQPQQPPKKPAKKEEQSLRVGDKAPSLSIEDWVKGKKIDKFESGHIYVVEFWATWCPPCRESIPHLTQLQSDYKDKKVTVIGVAASEHEKDARSRQNAVKTFVTAKGKEMEYTVAFDADSSMSKAWMEPAGQKGIPCAFVVGGDGKIAWIGHPMGGLDAQVKKAVEAQPKKTGLIDSEPVVRLASFQPETKKEQPAKVEGPTLKLGDKAPALDVSEWLAGQPVSAPEKGRAYVVYFWNTRNLDSRRVAPFLTGLQTKYKDATVVAISRKDRGGESAARVSGFLKASGDQMKYSVGFDADAKTTESWSKAAALRTMPQAFVVTQEGTIGWMGNPARSFEEMEEALGLAVNGKLTTETSKALTDKWKSELQKRNELLEKRRDAEDAGDWKASVDATEKLMAMDKVNAPALAAAKFVTLYLKAKEAAVANTYAAGAIDGALKNSPQELNEIAWTILDPANDAVAGKDLKLALKAAERANELTKGNDAYILDTLAKAYFDTGEVNKAIELQEKAVKLTPEDDQNAGEIKARLEEYKAKLPKK